MQIADIFTNAFLDSQKWSHVCGLIRLVPNVVAVRSHIGSSVKSSKLLVLQPSSAMASPSQAVNTWSQPLIGGQPPTIGGATPDALFRESVWRATSDSCDDAGKRG